MSVNGIWHGDDDHRDYDFDDDVVPEEIDDDTTTRLPIRESVSVEAMVAIVRGNGGPR